MRRPFITALVFLFVATSNSGCAVPVVVEGEAMNPTIRNGERWLVNKSVGEVKRGDIIVIRYPKDETKQYVKRVIGLPGEKIEIRQGVVFINDVALVEEYVDQEYNQSKPSFPPSQIPANHYYVMGDNRDNSSDSRYWGTVNYLLIEGKLYVRYGEGTSKK